MADFSREFIKSKGKPINYRGTEIISIDRISIPSKVEIKVRLISTNSNWRQGIYIETNDKIKSNNLVGKRFILWQELFEKNNEREYTCYSKNGMLLIWNAWNTGKNRGTDAWIGNAAMIKETIGNGVFRYRCNDGHLEEKRPIDFDDIIFEVEIIQ